MSSVLHKTLHLRSGKLFLDEPEPHKKINVFQHM